MIIYIEQDFNFTCQVEKIEKQIWKFVKTWAENCFADRMEWVKFWTLFSLSIQN